MSPRRKSTQPAGSLRETLVEAAAVLIAKKGPQGFSLREVARRAHVSEAAPYWHFTDREALLAAAAERGFTQTIARSDRSSGSSFTDPYTLRPGDPPRDSVSPRTPHTPAAMRTRLTTMIRRCPRCTNGSIRSRSSAWG